MGADGVTVDSECGFAEADLLKIVIKKVYLQELFFVVSVDTGEGIFP